MENENTNASDLEAQLTAAASGDDVAIEQQAPAPAPATGTQPAQQPDSRQAAAPFQPPVQAAPQPQQQTPTEQNVPMWRQTAQHYGVELPENVTETEYLQHLHNQAIAAQRLQQQIQQLAPHMSEFQKWKQQQAQQEAAQRQQESNAPWFKQFIDPPPWDPSWENMVTVAMDGKTLVPAPGAPPDIVERYNAAKAHEREMGRKLTRNPIEFLEKPSRYIAREEARAVYEEIRREEKEREFIDRTVNAPEMSWLYDLDEKSGKVRTDPFTGERKFSQWGQLYAQRVNDYMQRNYPVEHQHEHALNDVRLAYIMANPTALQPQQPQGDPRQQHNEQMLRKHENAHTPNTLGVLPGPATGVAEPPNAAGLSLEDQMALVLKDETDADLNEFRYGRRTA